MQNTMIRLPFCCIAHFFLFPSPPLSFPPPPLSLSAPSLSPSPFLSLSLSLPLSLDPLLFFLRFMSISCVVSALCPPLLTFSLHRICLSSRQAWSIVLLYAMRRHIATMATNSWKLNMCYAHSILYVRDLHRFDSIINFHRKIFNIWTIFSYMNWNIWLNYGDRICEQIATWNIIQFDILHYFIRSVALVLSVSVN